MPKKQFFSVYLTIITPSKKIHFAKNFQRLIMMPLAIFWRNLKTFEAVKMKLLELIVGNLLKNVIFQDFLVTSANIIVTF